LMINTVRRVGRVGVGDRPGELPVPTHITAIRYRAAFGVSVH
jgi:hypothetical protein